MALAQNGSELDKWLQLRDMLRRERRTGESVIYTKDGGLVSARPQDKQPEYNLTSEALPSNRF